MKLIITKILIDVIWDELVVKSTRPFRKWLMNSIFLPIWRFFVRLAKAFWSIVCTIGRVIKACWTFVTWDIPHESWMLLPYDLRVTVLDGVQFLIDEGRSPRIGLILGIFLSTVAVTIGSVMVFTKDDMGWVLIGSVLFVITAYFLTIPYRVGKKLAWRVKYQRRWKWWKQQV